MTPNEIEDRLHAAKPGSIEAELVAIALEETGAEHGALFVWDKEAGGLALVHHVVGGLTVTLPRVVRKQGGERAGVALHVYETDVLAKHAGNVEVAARAAGINKVTMYRLLKRRGLHLGRTVRSN